MYQSGRPGLKVRSVNGNKICESLADGLKSTYITDGEENVATDSLSLQLSHSVYDSLNPVCLDTASSV